MVLTQMFVMQAATIRAVAVGFLIRISSNTSFQSTNSRPTATDQTRQKRSKLDSHSSHHTVNFDSPQVKASLLELGKLLHIPPTDDVNHYLKAIVMALNYKFTPEALESAKTATDRPNITTNDMFPLGFDTGDEQVNKAGRILRLLYISELKDLQVGINDVLATAQSFVANPKTNAALGKVGI